MAELTNSAWCCGEPVQGLSARLAHGSHSVIGGHMRKSGFALIISFTTLLASTLAFAESATCRPPSDGQPLSLSGCQQGDTLVLREIHFETDSAQLRADSINFLNQLVYELRNNPTVKVEIQGHTDSVGSSLYNLTLSQNRAASVKSYLVGAGVNPAQLVPRGYGFNIPIADNATSQGRALNRRVEMKLVGTVVLAPEQRPAPLTEPLDVYISTFHAKPQVLTVPAGSRVKWTNYDEISHDITFNGVMGSRIWTSPWLGNTYTHTFEQPGEYHYRCSVHKDVNGKIVVKPRLDEVQVTMSPAYPGQTTSSYEARQSTKKL
ncbi:MAG: OmpA family protein [Spongiibacter sp.]|uniref:OmpA family protein n=1 Tax=Spongiibacter thalassae TaxID=2721624 RepID=A0ABX1GKE9_9GAMM|nr:OmpA family protein [Spongiibacter thalassae]MDX1504630.1 OmpA family protein [Spongiibacter sp.]NKI19440.1 OmpA family protein [Spongiibacter thalassae]